MSKNSRKNLFEVTSPCSQDWSEMKGNDKVRFCEHCVAEVNNLSAMRRKDAMRMVRESDGRICVRYVKNPQTNQPMFAENFYQIARRAPRLAAGAMTAALSLSSMAYAQGDIRAMREPTDKIEISDKKDAQENKTESDAGTLSGTITDSTGALVPGVIVTLTDEKNTFNRTATSNDDGIYEFLNLAAGTYVLKAEASGFAFRQIEGVQVKDESKADFLMEVGGEWVTVGGIGAIEYALPLLQAVADDNDAEIKSLLAGGADVNGKDENYDNITALFVAVENGNLKLVETLLEFGAKVNVRDAEKRSPLMRLDADAAPALVKLLLSYGAKIKAVDKERNTVLHHAVISIKADVLQLLIDEGAAVNAQNKQGETPLMIAADYENLEAVRVLLDSGANVNLRDKDDQTALGKARENDCREIIELLISYGAIE